MEEILNLISNYAFPIVMCLLVYFQNNSTLKKMTELMSTINTRLSIIERRLNILNNSNESEDWIE